MAIASLRVPISALPSAAGSTSWLGGLNQSIGGAIDQAGDTMLAREALGGVQPVQKQGFLSRLINGPQAVASVGQPQNPNTTRITPVQGSVAPGKPNDIYSGFIDTVKSGIDVGNGQKLAITNPYGLAAVAATGRSESGWDPSKVNAAWADPSGSGQPGTAGGIMSWRNERLANLRNFAQSQGEDPSNISPQTQAKFFLQEDPSLVQKLNGAKSPQEAASLMANAWKFGGYDQQGGEAARRQALTQNYYATEFANQQPAVAAAGPTGAAPVIPVTTAALPPPSGAQANTSMEQGDGAGPTQVASLDPRAGAPSAAPAFNPATASPTAMMKELGLNSPDPSQPAYRDPMVAAAGPSPGPAPVIPPAAPMQAPRQIAQNAPAPTSAGPTMIAAGVSPLARGTVNPEVIARMLGNPRMRDVGLALWKQNAGQATAEPWQFVQLPDGTLARANQQTGAVESIGQFQKPKDGMQIVPKGSTIYQDGQWITPPEGAGGDDKEYFGTTVPYYDANGNLHQRQLAKNGQGRDLDFGPGGTAAPATRTIDTGTELITLGPGGEVVSRTPKQNYQKSLEEATGTSVGKNAADAKSALPQIEGAANQMLSTIDSLDKDPYLPNMLGPANSRKWNISSDSERVQSKMDQIGGQSFLQAYNTLRGGGQITEVEGDKATKAMARLNTAQNEKDYREALGELRDIVMQGVQRARQKAGITSDGDASTPAATNENKRTSGVQWSIEK